MNVNENDRTKYEMNAQKIVRKSLMLWVALCWTSIPSPFMLYKPDLSRELISQLACSIQRIGQGIFLIFT